MKQTFIILLITVFNLSIFAEEIPAFSVKIVDYSRSWTSAFHYNFTDKEMSVVKVDNIEKNITDTLSHRELFGKEAEAIYKYIYLLSKIPFQPEYKDINGGERNQKRVILNLDNNEQSILISNFYQQDIAQLIIFLNTFIPDKRKMKELVDPNKTSK